MMRRRTALLGVSSLALLASGCAGGLPGDGGIGGTGQRASGDDPDEGGIGGTGIFGTVTALGSVEVNGLRLAVSGSTALESLAHRGEPVLPGDTVAAEAVRRDGGFSAARIAVFHPLIGTLERYAGALYLQGTRVILAADTPVRDLDGAPLPASQLRPGGTVAVSGLWRSREVVATSIRLLEPSPQVVLRGLLRRHDETLVIGGTVLDPRSVTRPPLGRFVTLRGVPGARGVVVEALDVQPLGVFSGRVAALSVEGFAAPNGDRPGFHLAGFGLPLDPASRLDPRPGIRQLFLGRYREGFHVESELPLPATVAARDEALRDEAAEAAIREWSREI